MEKQMKCIDCGSEDVRFFPPLCAECAIKRMVNPDYLYSRRNWRDLSWAIFMGGVWW